MRSSESQTANSLRLRKLDRQGSEISVASSASKHSIKTAHDQQGKLIDIEKSRTGGVRRSSNANQLECMPLNVFLVTCCLHF